MHEQREKPGKGPIIFNYGVGFSKCFIKMKVYKITMANKKTHLINFILNSLKKGYSPIILFCGKQRRGKTAMALRIAYEINNNFDIRQHMFYDVERFVNVMHESNNLVLVLDEAGVSLSPHEHADIKQRVYDKVVQTQGYKQNVIFLVLPFASEIGKQHRKHVNAIVEVLARGVYKLQKVSSVYSDLSDKPPWRENIEIVSGVPLPPPHIWDYYKEQGQKNYKESILQLQMEILASKKKNPGGINPNKGQKFIRAASEPIPAQ